MIDFNSAVKNEFLRFLFSIIIPGFIVSIFISYSLIANFHDPFNIFYGVSKATIFIIFNILFTLVIGFIIEIIGVYIESKYIDDQISKVDTQFNKTWKSYLNLDSDLTSSIILVQFYRTILTKLKFLINFPISLIMSVIVIVCNSLFFEKSFFNFCVKTDKYLFVIIILLIFIFSFMSYKRAKYCAEILNDYRKDIIAQYHVLKINKQRINFRK